jgi:hypothetical protein
MNTPGDAPIKHPVSRCFVYSQMKHFLGILLRTQPTSYSRTRVSSGTLVFLDARHRVNDEPRNAARIGATLDACGPV